MTDKKLSFYETHVTPPSEVTLEIANTPYGPVCGPTAAMKYLRELIAIDTQPPAPRKTFVRALEELINIHSIENQSDTPDWILAKLLLDVLDGYSDAVRARDTFRHQHGRDDTTLVPPPPAPEPPAPVRHTPRSPADWDGGDQGKMFMGPDAARWD
jgi:hypothetical protein